MFMKKFHTFLEHRLHHKQTKTTFLHKNANMIYFIFSVEQSEVKDQGKSYRNTF